MLDGYAIDERITDGLYDVLTGRLNSVIEERNSRITDGIHMEEIPENRIYNDYITLEELVDKHKAFPCFAYFMMDSAPEIRTNHLEMQRHLFHGAIFTQGSNGSRLIKRYRAAIGQTIEQYDTDIGICVLRGRITDTQYLVPIMYESRDYRVAVVTIEINSEVRK